MLFTFTFPLFLVLLSPLIKTTPAVQASGPAAQYIPATVLHVSEPMPTMESIDPFGYSSGHGKAPKYGSYRLDPSFKITSKPRIRNYVFHIRARTAALDGYTKQVLTINDQSPGPLIEANVGDKIVVEVHNHLPAPTSIHWHGFIQKDTPFMDGVPGTTQCPIPAKSIFKYEFYAQDYGTFWYHSHSSLQYTDGLQGPLVVHSPYDPLKRGTDFDVEEVIMMSDWFHDQAVTTIASQLLANGYHGTIAAPPPQSALINGQGVYNCSALSLSTSDDKSGECTTPESPPIFAIDTATKYRIRLVNSGSHTQFYFSIDNHVLNVVEVDNTPVVPAPVHRVPIHNAQRYSVIVDTSNDPRGSTFYMRVKSNDRCFAYKDPSASLTEYAILSVVRNGNRLQNPPYRTRTPVSNDWSDAIDSCVDLDDSLLVPSIRVDPPVQVDQRVVFNSVFGLIVHEGQSQGRFFVNGTTFTNYIYRPLLHDVNAGKELDFSLIANAVFADESKAVDIVINNLDARIDHPFHMHGHVFWVVHKGSGALTLDQANQLSFNTNNPLRRDTVTVPAGGHAVLRIISDNPGVWPFHCHIAFHLAAGKFAALVEHPKALQRITIPSKNFDLCYGGNPDVIEPAKRRSLHESQDSKRFVHKMKTTNV